MIGPILFAALIITLACGTVSQVMAARRKNVAVRRTLRVMPVADDEPMQQVHERSYLGGLVIRRWSDE